MKTEKEAVKENHLNCCPNSCSEIHVMCDLKWCASVGKHLASDHVYVNGVR